MTHPAPLPFPQPKPIPAVDGLPFGRVAVSASRTVAVGAAVGECGAVAWPAQQRAGAIAPRGEVTPPGGHKPCILESWAWQAVRHGCPEATASLAGESVLAIRWSATGCSGVGADHRLVFDAPLWATAVEPSAGKRSGNPRGSCSRRSR